MKHTGSIFVSICYFLIPAIFYRACLALFQRLVFLAYRRDGD